MDRRNVGNYGDKGQSNDRRQGQSNDRRQGQSNDRRQGQDRGYGNTPEPVDVSWSTVVEWIHTNPHASTPPPVTIENNIECINIPEETASVWTQMHVEPSTPLSCLLSIIDAEGYNASTESIRRSILRETCTALQIRAENELKGRAYPKTKLDAGIVEATEKEHSPWCPYGLAAIAALYKIQMIIINETDKKLSFVPEDVSAWTKENPVYYFGHNYRSVYIPPRGFGPESIIDWFISKEADGWTWKFKEIKGTIDEITAYCVARGVELPPGKVKKDILVEKASRGAVYKLLMSWKN